MPYDETQELADVLTQLKVIKPEMGREYDYRIYRAIELACDLGYMVGFAPLDGENLDYLAAWIDLPVGRVTWVVKMPHFHGSYWPKDLHQTIDEYVKYLED